MNRLEILSIAPGATVQDRGRVGYLRYGVTGGGAMDVYALAEGQALLGNGADAAALEMALHGGRFRAAAPLWVALSGAEMAVSLNDSKVGWRRSLRLKTGDILTIGAALEGVYGYLHVPGGFQTAVVLGARSTHLRAGFGHLPAAGQHLPIADPERACQPLGLSRPDYFDRRRMRAMWGPQSEYFSKRERGRFAAASFAVSPQRDRMGMRLRPDCGPIHSAQGLSIASDAINPGDIQVTGDGTPTVLLADHGSSGGYPRIAVLASADMPALVQVPSGQNFTLDLVSRGVAVAALGQFRQDLAGLAQKCRPLGRRPQDIADLLSYNLVGGVVRGDEYDAG